MLSRLKRSKPENTYEDFQRWRKERGPVGLSLLVEVLNWDVDQLDPGCFKERDDRRALIRSCHDDWRIDLREIQGELRHDLRGLLHPDPVKIPKGLPSARFRNLSDLLAKLNSFPWPKSGWREPTSYGVSVGNGLDGARKMDGASFEIDGERLGVRTYRLYGATSASYERARVRLYRIVYEALRSGEISKLRSCRNGKCRKFFILRRRECSNQCRTKMNNERLRRRGYFKNYYADQIQERLKQARRLLLGNLDKEKPLLLSKIAQICHLKPEAIERVFPDLI